MVRGALLGVPGDGNYSEHRENPNAHAQGKPKSKSVNVLRNEYGYRWVRATGFKEDFSQGLLPVRINLRTHGKSKTTRPAVRHTQTYEVKRVRRLELPRMNNISSDETGLPHDEPLMSMRVSS